MTDSFDASFLRAVADFQAGRAAQAADLCRMLLRQRQDHAGCLHLLGVLEFGAGKAEEAETLVRRSIGLRPGFAEMHVSFAGILAANGKNREAAAHYEQALILKPAHPQAALALAHLLNKLGAEACGRNQLADAAAFLRRAIEVKPDFPEALNNLGVVLFSQGSFTQAAAHHQAAIKLKPDYAAAYSNLGNALKAQGEWAAAIAGYRQALALKPDLAEARNNLGLALLHDEHDREAASDCFRAILDRDPDSVPALTHLGVVLCLQGDFSGGIACYEKALALEPSCRDARNNLGNALRAVGRLDEAIAAYRRVVAAQPRDADGHNNLAMSLLADGRFDKGWLEYEWRWQTPQLAAARRDFVQPQWRGEEGRGRVLLIHAEQGFGDTLQFCRYAPLAAARGWKLVLEVQPELVGLLRALHGVEAVIARGDGLPAFDFHCPMLSLPLAFGTRVETIPAAIPYLAADPPRTELWRQKIAAAGNGKKKIGLAWTGNPRLFSLDLAMANQRRSIPVEQLGALGELRQIQFYNLQKGARALPALDLVDFMPECRDFADTAALVTALDLVITVDTSVAHLAGALGKTVWLLNRFDSCWRWLQDRTDSPWYPTLSLFRQNQPGDWTGIIQEARKRLNGLLDLG